VEALEDRIALAADLDHAEWGKTTFRGFSGVESSSLNPGDVAVRGSDVESDRMLGTDLTRNNYGYTGRGYTIAVIDSGIDYNHADLGGGWGRKVVAGWDFVDNDADPMDTNGHGTSVAGLAAGSGANPGVAPEANLVALRVLDTNGNGTYASVESALQWVINNRTRYNIVAVNLSLGAGNYNVNPYTFLEDEFQSLNSAGVFIASAAGNEFYQDGSALGLAYTAVSDKVVSVGAVYDSNQGGLAWGDARDNTTAADRVISFSQRSGALDILAPGANITTARRGGGTTRFSGTSAATPIVAGASVVLRQAFDAAGRGAQANQASLLAVMRETGMKVTDGDDEDANVRASGLTFKRLNLAAAVNSVRGVAVVFPYYTAPSSSSYLTVSDPANLRDNTDWSEPLVGDFNKDGRQDVAARNRTTGQWWVGISDGRYLTPSIWGTSDPALSLTDFGVGDFNGDGRTDLIARDGGTGRFRVLTSNGSSFTEAVWGAGLDSAGWRDVRYVDMDADNRTDVVGRTADGTWQTGRSRSNRFDYSVRDRWSPLVTWSDVMVGDFNGDGRADLIGRWVQTGQWWASLSQGTAFATSLFSSWLPGNSWQDLRVADLNGDGRTDLLGRLAGTGQWWTAQNSGAGVVPRLWDVWNPSASWGDVVVGDFSGDGKADIAGRLAGSGQWWVSRSGATSGTTSLWANDGRVSGFGRALALDLTGDGKADLLGFGNPGAGAQAVAPRSIIAAPTLVNAGARTAAGTPSGSTAAPVRSVSAESADPFGLIVLPADNRWAGTRSRNVPMRRLEPLQAVTLTPAQLDAAFADGWTA
jgi:subtilisin family serine protease